MRGYESVRRFLPEESEAIPWLVMARQVWLMGAHTVYAEYSGCNWMGREYWGRQFRFLREELAAVEVGA